MMRLYLLVPLVSGARISSDARIDTSISVGDAADAEKATVQANGEHGVDAEVESEWMTCPTGRVKAAFNRGCAIVLSDNGRGRCRLRFEDGREDEMHAMHLEHHASCPQQPVGGFVGQNGRGIYNPQATCGGFTGRVKTSFNRGCAIVLGDNGRGRCRLQLEDGTIHEQHPMHLEYDNSCPQQPVGAYNGFVGQNGRGIYNPNGMVGQNGGGVYNPGSVGQNGHGMYNPNGFNGQNGHGIYNPNSAMPGQNRGGVYNPNGAMPGQSGRGVYNPNGAMPGQSGRGTYNPNGAMPGQNGGGTYPNGAMPGQNGGGFYNPNGAIPGQSGGGTYNPNGAMPGQSGGGTYNPNGAMPGQSGGGTYNPNGAMPGQNGGGQQSASQPYSCPLPGVYLPGFAANEHNARSALRAHQRCDELGWACAGITCSADDRCTVRAGGNRMESQSGEYSLVKGEACNQADNQADIQADVQAESSALWPQRGDDNTRCTRGAAVVVGSRMECQEVAIRENHPFYFFREDNNKCDTAMTCDSPITGTRMTWRIYALPMWPQFGGANTRCARGGTVDVQNLRECQERAESSGHAFYHFRWTSDQMDAGKCGTAESCESPVVGTNQDWRVYRNPVTTTEAVSSFQGSR